MRKRFCIFLLILTFIMDAPARAGENPVVVELFTSQGCASCPAADKILKEIAAQNNVIALACHVTYWDYLGWRDTLSRDFCTERQRGYAAQNPSHRVYTPQMLINGQGAFIGSRREQALRGIENARVHNQILPVSLNMKSAGTLTATLPALPAGRYTLRVFGYKRTHQESITAGENRGRNVDYTNSILFQTLAEDWDGTPGTRDLDIPQGQGTDNYAVLVQNDPFGPVVAAGTLTPR
jgi:hypothetical protein